LGWFNSKWHGIYLVLSEQEDQKCAKHFLSGLILLGLGLGAADVVIYVRPSKAFVEEVP
jgi:hypothetical protein